jgi:hypothetical protein
MARIKVEQDPGVRIFARLPEDVYNECAREAIKERRSMSQQVVIIIERWANEQKDKAFLSPASPPMLATCPVCHAPTHASPTRDCAGVVVMASEEG